MKPDLPTDPQSKVEKEYESSLPIDESLHREFLTTLESRQKLQLSNVVINYGLKMLRLDASVKSIIYVTAVLAMLLWVLTTLLTLIVNHSRPAVISTLLVSFLTAFSFGIIKYLDYHLISSRSNIFPQNLSDYAIDNQAIERLVDWHRSFLSLKKQITTSSVMGVAGFVSTASIANTRSLDFKFGSYLLVFCCFFAVGHGAYCTLMIPTLVRRISKLKLKLFWLNPADTAWVKEASTFFTKLTIADALVFAVGMTGLYLLKPWQSTRTTWLALAWLLTGVTCLSYIFLFPHYYLDKCIKREKKTQVKEMQDKILSYKQPATTLSAAEFKDLLGHITLYNKLVVAKESAIELQNSFKVLTSVSVFVLSYLAPILLRLIGFNTR